MYRFVTKFFIVFDTKIRNFFINVVFYSSISLLIVNNRFFMSINNDVCQIKTSFFKYLKKLFRTNSTFCVSTKFLTQLTKTYTSRKNISSLMLFNDDSIVANLLSWLKSKKLIFFVIKREISSLSSSLSSLTINTSINFDDSRNSKNFDNRFCSLIIFCILINIAFIKTSIIVWTIEFICSIIIMIIEFINSS